MLSLENILWILITFVVVGLVFVAMKGIVQSNSDKATQKANSEFGGNVKFSVVQAGTNTILYDETGGKAEFKIDFTDLVGVTKDTYLSVAIINPGIYDWKLDAIYNAEDNTLNVTGIDATSWAGKLEQLVPADYSPNTDFALKLVFKPSITPVSTGDEIVIKVALGQAPPVSITLDIEA
jgi:hypothetical protein